MPSRRGSRCVGGLGRGGPGCRQGVSAAQTALAIAGSSTTRATPVWAPSGSVWPAMIARIPPSGDLSLKSRPWDVVDSVSSSPGTLNVDHQFRVTDHLDAGSLIGRRETD